MLIAPYFFPRNRGGAVQVYHQLLCNTRAFRFLVVSERRDCSSALLQRFDESSDRLFGYGIRRIAAFELHFNPGTSQWRRVMSGAEFFRKSIQEFDRILGDTCPDLVLCGGTFAAGWLMRRVPSRIPLVTYIHGEELTLGAGPSILQPYFRYCQRRTLRDAALNITVSRYSAGLAISTAKIAPGAVRLLPNFVDTGHFNPPADRDGLRRRLGWSGKTVLLSVARLEPRKGIDQTLRAMASLHHEDRLPRNWLYVIGGCGEQKVVLEELASELGIADRVQFPGFVPDDQLPDYYGAADLFIQTNRQIGGDTEGFGIVFLEASACGTAVVGGIAGGTGDAIEDGVTGLRVDSECTEKIASAIRLLLDEPRLRTKMGQRGRARVEAEFTLPRATARFESILATALSNSRAPIPMGQGLGGVSSRGSS
jgi:phosphatidylinositol alpha-1,6-mannosyltransferase